MPTRPTLIPALTRDHLPAAVAVLWGMLLAAGRAWEPSDYFWSNFAWYWLPQALILGLLLLTRPSLALFTGVALALSAHLQLMCLWINAPEDVMGWLFYLFDFPGALIGTLIARYRARRIAPEQWLKGGLSGFAWVAIGLASNFLLVLSTQH
ncbi:hypothetical protein [Pseudomonas sp. PH1b]|uniref:hypothetical protein n=1 Tax=Pseudomonas sp. PH1b TaxID=1397282 RepID=UPI0004680E26|nr:hypothetical protein [Pseudomonas sp. PH1b]BFD41212.1 hypothetical protein FFPRI1PSEUD_27110 [Pseudomonas sp. FFPRI_1]